MQALLTVARKDYDFDLFCRRIQMAKTILNLPPEEIMNFHSKDFYSEFWKLSDEISGRVKFSEEYKNISEQILYKAFQETNPARQQYFALSLILFGEVLECQNLISQKFWHEQLRKDYQWFVCSGHFVNNFLTHKLRSVLTKMAENESFAAYLYDKYLYLIEKHANAVVNEKTCPTIPSKDYKIFYCWLQGEENLPILAQCCYNSLKQNAGNYKIVFIDEKNFNDYVDIAPHIMDKFRAGKISRTHFSDILRVNLLERHGGLWLDASFLVTEPLANHKDILEKTYFTQSFCKEKSYKARFANHITYGMWMAGIQGTTLLHAPLYSFIKDFFNEYLKDFDSFEKYFLFDTAIFLAYDNIPQVKKEFDNIPINNQNVWGLRKHLNDLYEDYPFDKILKDTFLYNINWKREVNRNKSGTVFREIQKRYAPETPV